MSASNDEPILRVEGLRKNYGSRAVCDDISFDLWPGEVLAVVGESGAGKTSLLKCLSGQAPIDAGHAFYRNAKGREIDIATSDETLLKRLQRTEWGLIHQNPRDGLRFGVSAGANVGERLMALGARHYGNIRSESSDWLQRLEISGDRIDDLPSKFSGGMQQRLQIARNLVTKPRLVFMDEPTGGLDVSVQARLLDLLRVLVRDLGLAAVLVTHDLAVARLLGDRLLMMKDGKAVELGLVDQVLDDPQTPYAQLLVSSVLQI
jgi:putative phosphonate transport system ATP-binding protein